MYTYRNGVEIPCTADELASDLRKAASVRSDSDAALMIAAADALAEIPIVFHGPSPVVYLMNHPRTIAGVTT